MSSHSGTIGRSKGLSIGGHIRRQRSVEWQQGYSSSDDDDRGIHGAINPSFDSQLLAQLIAQSQELSNKCKYWQNEQRVSDAVRCMDVVDAVEPASVAYLFGHELLICGQSERSAAGLVAFIELSRSEMRALRRNFGPERTPFRKMSAAVGRRSPAPQSE